jgi:hypothetical protein
VHKLSITKKNKNHCDLVISSLFFFVLLLFISVVGGGVFIL